MKYFILIITSVLLYLPLHSQESYSSGNIITKNGAITKGFINYKSWENTPQTIKFKKEIKNKANLYKADDIFGFSVNNLKFESAKINNIAKKQFVQTLINGKKSLYMLKNSLGEISFFIKKDTNIFVLLINKEKIKKTNGERIVSYDKKYIKQLELYLNDCGKKTNFKKTPFNKRGFIKAFKKYYKCANYKPIYRKSKDKSFNYGVLVGASNAFIKFKGSSLNYLTKADIKASLNFSGGLFFDYFIPKVTKNLSINNELMFSSIKISAKYLEYKNSNVFKETNSEIGISYIKLNNLIRYKIQVKNTHAYFNTGISNAYAISETNNKIIKNTFYTTTTIKNEKAIDIFKYERAFIVGIGAEYKKTSIDFRYERSFGLSNHILAISKVDRFDLLFGYRF